MKNLKNKINFSVAIFLAFLIGVAVISATKRYGQFSYWKKHKNVYFVKDTPMMTTLDAYYWLRYSKEIKNNTYGKIDKLRAYPEGKPAPSPVPMLSWMLAELSKIFNKSVYYVGIYLIPILASLFIIPLGIYFYLNGFPTAAILSGFIGSFSFSYYVRSCTGRVDTDSLNLFFPFLASLFIYLISTVKKEKIVYLYAALAGLSMLLYNWWYYQVGLIAVYFVFFALFLVVQKTDKKVAAICLILFIIFVNPITFLHSFKGVAVFLSKYGSVKVAVKNAASVALPNINRTITETQHKSITSTLKFFIDIPWVSFLGLLSFAVVALLKWRRFIPVLPLFFLGMLVFKSSNRLAMYLVPFVGAGLGFIIDYIMKYLKKVFNLKELHKTLISCIAGFLIFFMLSGKTAYSYIPGPSIPVDLYSSFHLMKRIMPKGSAIYSWWDFGYAYMDVTERATFHDGGVHGGWITYLVAQSIVKTSQQELYNTISLIDNKKLNDIIKLSKDNNNLQKILGMIKNYDKSVNNPNIYVVFTRDMVGKFGAMNFIGNWNFYTKKGSYNGFGEIRCSGYSKGKLMCGRYIIDLSRGLLNNTKLNRLIVINNGKIAENRSIEPTAKYFLEILMINKRIFKVYILDRNVYDSNFNQMYLLGNYDKKLFQEVLNYFPTVRIFKAKKK